MSEPDAELESLMAKRMAEMKSNVARAGAEGGADGGGQERPARGPRDIVVESLGHRGMEVLGAAEAQRPRETAIIVQKLGEMIERGEIMGPISGGELMELFRAVGVGVRLQTRISVESDGKLVSLSDRLGASGAGGG